MFSRQNPRQIFLSAVVLLLFSGIATGVTIYKLNTGERWVRHTFRVQLSTSEIETNLAKAGQSRQGFIGSGDAKYLEYLVEARSAISEEMSELNNLTHDNRDQQVRLERLERLVQECLDVIDKSIDLAKKGTGDREAQSNMTAELVDWTFETTAIAEEMSKSEELLLDRRMGFTAKLFFAIVAILAVTFLLSIYLFWEYYRLLAEELKQRKRAEEDAQRLSGEVLHAQDEERRRISRELHDGLGQTITGAKMLADSFFRKAPSPEELKELSGVLEEAVNTTRTVSHLLYPPLLDEIGFLAAARWFVEGFSKRTGIAVAHDIPEEDWRFSPITELTLFRVLQESLMNVQRHSGSTRAKVAFKKDSKKISLSIQDFGVGLPHDTLNHFAATGTDVGVGLAGMKQRVLEQAGTFSLTSDSNGTMISATLPTENTTS